MFYVGNSCDIEINILANSMRITLPYSPLKLLYFKYNLPPLFDFPEPLDFESLSIPRRFATWHQMQIHIRRNSMQIGYKQLNTSGQSHEAIFFLWISDSAGSFEVDFIASSMLTSTTGIPKSAAFFTSFDFMSSTLSACVEWPNVKFASSQTKKDGIPLLEISAATFSVIRDVTEPPSFFTSSSTSSFDRPNFESRTNFKPSKEGGFCSVTSDSALWTTRKRKNLDTTGFFFKITFLS